ncbi:MAG: virulence RhuM family protein [Bacteroidales bacterium]|nr:virulence RhuM family protein [Bacteroidales bacterium]
MDEEIKLYQSEDALIKLEVRIACDTVWLTQQQMTQLFQTTKQNISLHIRNIYKEGELDYDSTVKDFLTIQSEGKRKVQRSVIHYNLDVIISIGYRVKSMYGTKFRIWATSILKEYFFGRFDYPRMERLENRVTNVESQVADIIQQALPPTQGIFFDGQIFDAYQFVSDLIRSAKRSIVLFDNYADDSVLTQLAKRTEGVAATVCASRISEGLRLDVKRHNAQYAPIGLREVPAVHDRFLLIDDTILYTFGASFKDLGKKMFCFNKMESEDVIEAVRNALHNIDFDY